MRPSVKNCLSLDREIRRPPQFTRRGVEESFIKMLSTSFSSVVIPTKVRFFLLLLNAFVCVRV